jgi:hypothetical protein
MTYGNMIRPGKAPRPCRRVAEAQFGSGIGDGGLVKLPMVHDDRKLTESQVAEARRRRLDAMQLHAIEGNPLDADDVAMFEMFEREAWSHERCRAYILERALKAGKPHAAE